MSTYTSRIAADNGAVSSLRHAFDEFLRSEVGMADPMTLDAAALVLTELAANVVDHTDSDWIDLAAAATATELVLEVSHDGDVADIPPIDTWDRIGPDTDHPDRGHGLRLIRRLTSWIEIDAADGSARVRCALPLN